MTQKSDRILVTGGSGLLGTALRQVLPDADYPSHFDFNVIDGFQMTDYLDARESYGTLIHAAAVIGKISDKEPRSWRELMFTNIYGTCCVADICSRYGMRLVYISTDYVFCGCEGNYREDSPLNPVNPYAWSKLGGECAVMLYKNSLIIRTSFSPRMFPYEAAYTDQFSSREPVDVVAAKIAKAARSDLTGILHVGSPRRSTYDYVRSITDKQIQATTIASNDLLTPRDVSLDCHRYDVLLGGEQ